MSFLLACLFLCFCRFPRTIYLTYNSVFRLWLNIQESHPFFQIRHDSDGIHISKAGVLWHHKLVDRYVPATLYGTYVWYICMCSPKYSRSLSVLHCKITFNRLFYHTLQFKVPASQAFLSNWSHIFGCLSYTCSYLCMSQEFLNFS